VASSFMVESLGVAAEKTGTQSGVKKQNGMID
jgi:hypothetical protein